jgi:hypothetical protein
MPDNVQYLELAKDAFSELGSKVGEIGEIIKKGVEQADTRKSAILTIHQMCDALQLACDLVSKELSASIIDFNTLRSAKEEALRGFFKRTAFKFSDGSLRTLLHEGKVCGELHALGDRFTQPFSDVTPGGVSVWENVMTFFRRSNSMSDAMHGLYEGEMDYLRAISDYLNSVRDAAENATAIDWGNIDELRTAGDTLAELMRKKRQILQDQIRRVKDAADDCIKKLH